MRKFGDTSLAAAQRLLRQLVRLPVGFVPKLVSSHAAMLTAMLSVAFLACACSWNIGNDYDPEIALSFLPSVGKPGGESQSVPSEGSFGLSLWQYSIENSQAEQPSATSSTGGSRSASEFQQIVDMNAIEWKDGLWTLPSQQFWPSKRYGLQALAYSPCSAASACTLTEGVIFSGYNAGSSPTIDLLYTEPICAESKSGNGGAISLPFHHALTELSLRFIAHTPGISLRVREVRIPAARLRGNFHSLPTPEWKFSGGTEVLKFEHVTECLSSTPISIPSIFLPPQSLSEGFIVSLSYIDPLDIEREVLVQTEPLNIQLKGDRQYVFTISVDPESAIVIESGISK